MKLCAVLGSALVLAVAAGPAWGHTFDRTLKPVLDEAVPAAGVHVALGTVAAPALYVQNRSRRTLEVLGTDGRPFVRLGPRGVEANVASPDLYRTNAPVPGASVPAVARPGATPVWVRIARAPHWSWFEHRIAARPGRPWSIPARLGGRELRIGGSWRSVRIRGVFRTVVDGTRPAVDGLSVEPLANGPALFVQNATGKLLELADARNSPFLRVGPSGAELARPGGSWTRMGRTPAWAWVERRAAAPHREWSIHGTLGGRRLAVYGHVEWVPISAHHRPQRRLDLVFVAAATPLLLGLLLAVPRLSRMRA